MSSRIIRTPCPSCGSHDVEIDPNTVSEGNAQWACRRCGKRFGKPDYEALSLFFNDDDVPYYVEVLCCEKCRHFGFDLRGTK